MPNTHEALAAPDAGRVMEDAFTSLHRWCEAAVTPWVCRLLQAAQEHADLCSKTTARRAVSPTPPAW